MNTPKRTGTRGRPRKDPVTEFVRKYSRKPAAVITELAELGLSKGEIARFLGISEDTVTRSFAADYDKGRECRKMRLRAKQYELALAGNVSLLIWLGKVECGQREGAVANDTPTPAPDPPPQETPDPDKRWNPLGPPGPHTWTPKMN